jgi:protein TonB
MFEDSLMESGGRIKTNQKWTGLISTLVQLGLVGFLVLLPLIFTEALPKGQLTTWLVAPPPPPPPPPPAAPQIQHVQKVSEIVDGALRTPSKIPKKIQMIKEDEAPAPNAGVQGVVGGMPGGTPGGVSNSLFTSALPPPKVATPQKLRVSSGVAEGLKIHDVTPTYPQMARIAHIQGDVLLQATISKSGVIENLHGVQGHPILIQAAMDAVKQWKYKPYILNGEPVEVETQIKVQFHM